MKYILPLLLAVSFALAQEPKQSPWVTADSLIRPANATAYAVNDVVNDSLSSSNKILAFKHASKNADGSGVIVSAVMEADTANVTNPYFRLLLFKDSVASVADNAAWVPTHAYNARYIGSIDFALVSNGTGSAIGESQNLLIPFVSAGRLAGGYIYGVLIAKGAYTPGHNGKIRVKLGILRR